MEWASFVRRSIALLAHIETGHLTRSSDTRVALNRGTASILMPNQGAVMLWQAFRSTAIRLSAAMVQSLRYLKARKQHAVPARVDEEIQARFKRHALTVKLPTNPAAQIPEKKIEAAA